jgi:hypothetical protein
MSTQEPLYAAIAVNGAYRRRPTTLKPIINLNESDLNLITINIKKQPNHNSKPSEA